VKYHHIGIWAAEKRMIEVVEGQRSIHVVADQAAACKPSISPVRHPRCLAGLEPLPPPVPSYLHGGCIALIVGLNVATKGAQPFSRGKRVVPGKRDVPHRPFLPPKK
jgi:hypothetical protein